MKKIVFILTTTFLLISCKEEIPTNSLIQTEYSLEGLENDPNWSEISNYTVFESYPCYITEIDSAKCIESKEELDRIYDAKVAEKGEIVGITKCNSEISDYYIDFNSEALIVVFETSNGGTTNTRKVFYNDSLDKTIYFLNIVPKDPTYNISHYAEAMSVPKSGEIQIIINNETKVE